MLHLLYYPRELIAERAVFTPADQAQIAACRGPHTAHSPAASVQ